MVLEITPPHIIIKKAVFEVLHTLTGLKKPNAACMCMYLNGTFNNSPCHLYTLFLTFFLCYKENCSSKNKTTLTFLLW